VTIVVNDKDKLWYGIEKKLKNLRIILVCCDCINQEFSFGIMSQLVMLWYAVSYK